MSSFTYKTISESGTALYKDRGSRFLGYAYPVQRAEEIKQYVQALKEEHPKAVHYCYAYRLDTEGQLFRTADDGEPSGSAGKPILSQIDSLSLSKVLVVVVRYFGGTLLGVPGLIQAYKQAARMALEQSAQITLQKEKILTLSFPYETMNDVMRVIRSMQLQHDAPVTGLFCQLTIYIPLLQWEEACSKFNTLQHVETVK